MTRRRTGDGASLAPSDKRACPPAGSPTGRAAGRAAVAGRPRPAGVTSGAPEPRPKEETIGTRPVLTPGLDFRARRRPRGRRVARVAGGRWTCGAGCGWAYGAG